MTIPISPTIINIAPGVLAAAGDGFDLVGLVATSSSRVPIGTYRSFADADEVGEFFGLGSPQYSFSETYFAGYDNATKTPGALLYVQMPASNVSAYVQGANPGLSLSQLQALTGTLTVVVDGYTWTASGINLSSATSFSNAASILTTDLTASPPQEAQVTASIAETNPSFTGSIGGNVMYVTAVASGTIVPGMTVTGTGVSAGTKVDEQLSGTPGGIGVYAVSIAQVVASESLGGNLYTMTVSAVASGVLAVGQNITGAGIPAGTLISALDSGTGGTGTYYVTAGSGISSESVTAYGATIAVTYDSVSGAFVITSGSRGAVSTMAFPTGSLASPLCLTSAKGAILSQGAAAVTPQAFMASILSLTQNWATFTTDFDPDGGPGTIAQKLNFAQWAATQNNRFAYVEWDTDPNDALTYPGTSTFGYTILNNGYSGTCPNYAPLNGVELAAFVMGMTAAIDFDRKNGRITTAFKHQSGFTADVTDPTQATNLAGDPQTPGSFGNGYNFYGAYATASEGFVFYNRGTISGSFQWYDTYVNQIWLNQGLVSAMATLLTTANSIPYNSPGYAQIEAAAMGPINDAVNAGVIRAGVVLTPTQVQQINQAAGAQVASVVQQRGWALVIGVASGTVRQSRGSPPITLWYSDGESVQAINIASIVVQ